MSENACDGCGKALAVDAGGLCPNCAADYESGLMPTTGHRWHRCLWCLCHVTPAHHQPGSEDCDRAKDERIHSIAAD